MGENNKKNNNYINLDKQTLNILQKYGVNMPQRIAQGRALGFKKNNIIVNNNDNNITNNNVIGPVQGRELSFKKDEQKKKKKFSFSNWIKNIFTRHSEQTQVREKAFRKYESSLSRASGRILEKIGKFGKTLTTAFSAKRLVSYINGDTKKLLFVYGAHLIAKNWGKFIGFISNVEQKLTSFADYLYGTAKTRGISGFVSDIASLVTGKNKLSGGEEHGLSKTSTVFFTIANFLGVAKDEGAKVGKSGKTFMDTLIEYMKRKLDERYRCLKIIPLPDFNGTDSLLEKILKFGKWVGSYIHVLMGGSGVLTEIFDDKLKSRGQKESMVDGYNYDLLIHDPGAIDAAFNGGQGTGAVMYAQDFTEDGELNGTVSASLNQGTSLERMLTMDFETTGILPGTGDFKVKTAGIISGLSRLETAANRKDETGKQGTVVNPKLLEVIGKALGIKLKGIPGKYEEWKLIKTPLTAEERDSYAGVLNKVSNRVKDEVVYDVASKYSDGMTSWLDPDRKIGEVRDDAIGMLSGFDAIGGLLGLPKLSKIDRYVSAGINGVDDAINGKTKLAMTGGGKYKLVPASYKLKPGETEEAMTINGKRQTRVRLLRLTGDSMKFLRKKIAEKAGVENVKFNMTDYEALEKVIIPGVKRYFQERTGRDVKFLDGSFTTQEKEELKSIMEEFKNDKSFSEVWDKSSKEFVDTAKESMFKTVKALKLSDENKQRASFLMRYFMEKLNLEPFQAMGFIGNFHYESGGNFHPLAHHGGYIGPCNGKAAFGIAQWTGVRRKRLVERYGTTPTLEQEAEYVVWELNNLKEYKDTLSRLRKTTNVVEAASVVFGYYEFSAGVEKALQAMGKSKGNGNPLDQYYKHLERAKALYQALDINILGIADGHSNSNTDYIARSQEAVKNKAAKEKDLQNKINKVNKNAESVSKQAKNMARMAENINNHKQTTQVKNVNKTKQKGGNKA